MNALGVLALAVAMATMTFSAATTAAAAPKTLVFACEAEPSQLDPHISNTWNTFRILTHMFESFVART